ncbi:MAG: hypothetical protein GY811_07520 [Myxococcales bacterium]|nr:hypothetical protein [Myxococcales bacterium]
MKYPVLVSFILPLSFSIASCGIFGGSDECNDGADNDKDGLIDSMDPGCTVNGDKESPDPILTACNDSVDNDGDGLIDTEDPGCTDGLDEDEYNEPVSACQDGIDNDMDGLIDFPYDPGCTFSIKDSELDDCPDGANCPDCSNGIDDDEDGQADYPDDLGCNAAGDLDEFNADPSICGAAVLIQPLPNDGEAMGQFTGSAANELISDGCGGTGEEHVYVYTTTVPESLTVTTDFEETVVDTVVYVRGECRQTDTELGCNDDAGLNVSTLDIERIEPGTYYIIVDTASSTAVGNYRLSVDTFTPEKEPCVVAASTCKSGLVCRLFTEGGVTATSETCEKPECSDGEDSDGDGLVDFPFEPGCLDPADNDETDDCPTGPGCAQCSNELDDDGDTISDYPDDPGCNAASDDLEVDDCIPGVEVISLGAAGVSGTTAGTSSFDPTCILGNSGAEDIFQFDLDRAVDSLTFSTIGSSYDTVLSVRYAVCDDVAAELACEDPDSAGETIVLATPAQGDYFVFVDGSFFGDGAYTLSVEGVLPDGAACTPGEPGFVCTPGFTCRTNTCVVAACNDAVDGDNDSDGNGFPNDPGCDSISDDDESDNCPSGAGCPACSNNIDDDTDTFTDFPADLGCKAASDNLELDECIAGVTVLDLQDVGASGTTDTAADSFDPSCDSLTAGEDIYAYRNTRNLETITFSTLGSGGDTVLSIRQDDCGDEAAEIDCNGTGANGQEITITSPVLSAFYFVFVDTDFSTATVDYILNVSGIISPGNACIQGDGQFTCSAGFICDGTDTCVATQCNDNISNDADGLVDFLDPGCASLDDNDESDDPNPLPACADGVDNDADLATDFPADPGCSKASDTSEVDCEDSDPLVSITASVTSGTTTGATDDFTPTCQISSTAPEVAHEFSFPGELDSLSVTTNGTMYDTVLYIRPAACVATDLECDDDDGDGLQSLIDLTNVPSGLYFIFVDAYSTYSGPYTLTITGVIKSGEACDPDQITAGVLTCASGTTCTTGICQ